MSLTILDTMPDLLMVVWERTRKRMPSWLFSVPGAYFNLAVDGKVGDQTKETLAFSKAWLV